MSERRRCEDCGRSIADEITDHAVRCPQKPRGERCHRCRNPYPYHSLRCPVIVNDEPPPAPDDGYR